MKVAVTGAAGFIGSNLVERLLARGDEVHGIDDLSHGSLDNLAALSDERIALLPAIDDPDHLCEAWEAGSPAVAAVCRFDDAREMADLHTQMSERLSAHHRVHSVSLELELADALGDWVGLASQTDRALAAIEANLATPCVRNPRDLLLCGLAHLCLGDEARAAELERDGMRLAGEGYEPRLIDEDVCLTNCPFDRLVADHSELVCGMNLALLEGLLGTDGPVRARMDARPGECCVVVEASKNNVD